MKIQINEHESYEMAVPETMKLQDFKEWFHRLKQIAKVIIKDDEANSLEIEPSQSVSIPALDQNGLDKQERKALIKKTRDLEVLKAYYTESREAAVRTMKSYGLNPTHIHQYISVLKRNYKPSDIGLKRWRFV